MGGDGLHAPLGSTGQQHHPGEVEKQAGYHERSTTLWTPRCRAPPASPVGRSALGISEIEERVYEALLDRSGATLSDLERELTLPARKLQRVLDALEQKGLITRTSSPPRRHIPASPDIAVEALLLRRHDELRRARGEIQRLQERAAASAGEQRQMIELVTTREAERHVFEQMQQAAQHELIFLERPPILIAGPEQPNETETKALSRGVRYRSIADRAFLELPGVLTRVREDMQAGEEVRVVSKLPFKMVMADRSIALIPLNLERPGSPTMLVRSSALLDALYAMFELLWNQATPISFTREGAMSTGELAARFPKKPNSSYRCSRRVSTTRQSRTSSASRRAR